MIDVAAIKARFEMLASVLDERERLFAACEARAAGHGGVVAVSRATGMARSTIDRGLAELKAGPTQLGGGGCVVRVAAASLRSRRSLAFCPP